MINFTEQFDKMPGIEDISLEDAQERLEELRERRAPPPRNLESLARTQNRVAREQYFASFSEPRAAWEKIKTLFGFGPEYEYRKHLEKLDITSAAMQQLSANSQQALATYSTKALDLATLVAQDKEELALNICLINNYEQRKSGIQSDLATLEKQQVYGTSTTAESMKLRANLLDLEKQLLRLHSENNDLAVRIVTQTSMRATYEHVQEKVFAQHVGFERQRTAFNEHREYAHANEDLVKGLGGVASAKAIYMESAVLVEQLQGMQTRLHKTLFEELPSEFRIRRAPGDATEGAMRPGKPYWQTVVREIFGNER